MFAAGLALQWTLVRWCGLAAFPSYLVQAVVSVEASFLLNRRFTWPDRDVGFWAACWRFNAQKAVISLLNFALYAGLIWGGMNYLLANIALTTGFTLLNYTGGDKWSFAARPVAASPARTAELPAAPAVTVVIPCRDNPGTIGPVVAALTAQDYPQLRQIIIVGSQGDTTWQGLPAASRRDDRVMLLEQPPTIGLRDPNIKRDRGVQHASGDVIAFADSDIVMDPGWLSAGVRLIRETRADCVAGGMRSIHDGFLGRFIDRNRLGAKTPRVGVPYYVTAANFGHRGRKPPVTANVIVTRRLYEEVPLDVRWAFGYEDYEWFWRIARAGFAILHTAELTGAHHHRRQFRKLVREYLRSADGCARFVRAHPDCPLARKRYWQAIIIPVAVLAAVTGAGLGIAAGHPGLTGGAIGLAAVTLTAWEYARTRTAESLLYPFLSLYLAAAFTFGLARGLIQTRGRRDW